jgi:recombinational DNA repair protein RecR
VNICADHHRGLFERANDGNEREENGRIKSFREIIRMLHMFTINGNTSAHEMVLRFYLRLITNLKTNHSAHYFCHECINNSIKRNGKCPLCKKDVQRRDINRDEQMEMLVKNYAEFVHLDGKRRRRNTILYQSQLALTQQQQRKKKKMKKKM